MTSSPPSSSAVSSSSSSPNSPPTYLPTEATSLPSSSRSALPPMTVVVISSCAACKFLGQICTENCVLATCFPPDDLIKFTTVHRVFGASNIIKLLQELPESQRADAVSSMVYEANARLRDPVYGSVGSIFLLQKRVTDLQVQLAKAQAETISSSSPRWVSPSFSYSPPPPASTPTVVVSPCGACKILRRRCTEKCVLAPYFPPNDPFKFTTAHRVFGASNIIKFLQELPESQRADAVSSMVYEANARLRDPVYGCAGSICQLQKQVGELQAQLAKAQAEIVNMQCQQANLMALICMEMGQSPQPISPPQQSLDNFTNNNFPMSYLDDNISNFGSILETLWT